MNIYKTLTCACTLCLVLCFTVTEAVAQRAHGFEIEGNMLANKHLTLKPNKIGMILFARVAFEGFLK